MESSAVSSARRVEIVVALLAAILAAAPALAQPPRWPRAPLTEVARAAVGADAAWSRHGLTGRGATLCLVDTGADASHPDLSDAEHASRVRWVLDAFAPPRGAHGVLEEGFGGAVYGPGDALPGDPHGHGTAMASIALGDGGSGATPGPTAGMAPAAAVIVARAWDPEVGGFPDEAVLRGVGFCRAVAELDPSIDPRRMVVLLSLGGHDGAHDGRGPFERALEAHATALPIVVAAGNDGDHAVRAGGRIHAGETATVDVNVPRARIADAAVALTVSLRPLGSSALEPIAIEAPDGERIVASAGEHVLGGARVTVTPSPDRHELSTVVLRASGGTLPSGTYRVHLRGRADFEVWLAGARLGATFFAPSLGGPWVAAREQITIPATAPALIAVGAAVARTEVETGAGRVLEEPGAPGAPTAFSSRGPTADGAPKPDLIAPGGWLLAALSGDVERGDPENLVGGRVDALTSPDGRVAVRGSSAAAAVVAGALLLAVELDPTPAPNARALLIASADADAWDPARGWGQLDVERLLDRWLGTRDAAPRLVATRALVPGDPRVWLTARGLSSATLTLWLHDRRVTATSVAGTAELAIDPGALTVGRPLVIEARLDGAPLRTLEVPVVLDRSPRGAAAPSGGGCRAGPTDGPAPIPLVVSLAFAAGLAFRRRRGAQPSSCSASGRTLSRISRNERT